jgi:hypothetical protein
VEDNRTKIRFYVLAICSNLLMYSGFSDKMHAIILSYEYFRRKFESCCLAELYVNSWVNLIWVGWVNFNSGGFLFIYFYLDWVNILGCAISK